MADRSRALDTAAFSPRTPVEPAVMRAVRFACVALKPTPSAPRPTLLLPTVTVLLPPILARALRFRVAPGATVKLLAVDDTPVPVLANVSVPARTFVAPV